MDKRHFLSFAAGTALVTLTSACTTTSPEKKDDSPAAKRQSIDTKVDAALVDLFRQVPQARELVAKSKGTLVFPSVISAGFMIGGSYGEGALRKGAESVGYYSTAAGSVGLLAGAQSKAVFILFMTQDSVDKFQASEGWTAGVDASVAVIKTGADAKIDSQTLQQPILSFVLTGGGLMANLSFDGTKFTKMKL